MPTDYKKPPRPAASSSRSRRKPPPSRLAWFSAGLASGVLASLLAVELELGPRMLASFSQGLGTVGEATVAGAPEERSSAKPRFEFYHMLPEMEVAVPEEELVEPPRRGNASPSEAAARTAGPTPGGVYVLQVGSFRRHEEAERLRASLALAGLEARIQTVAVDGEQAWHRVRLGPFSDLRRLNDARVRLREHDLQAMVLKIKG